MAITPRDNIEEFWTADVGPPARGAKSKIQNSLAEGAPAHATGRPTVSCLSCDVNYVIS
jgi:hypothetical protein